MTRSQTAALTQHSFCCVDKGETSEQRFGAIFRRFQFPVPVRGGCAAQAPGGVCAGPFCSLSPLAIRAFTPVFSGVGVRGPLYKGGLAESEGAFPRAQTRGEAPHREFARRARKF